MQVALLLSGSLTKTSYVPRCDQFTLGQRFSEGEGATMDFDYKFSFDPKCQELARHFLADYKHSELQVSECAQAIQNAIEQWLDARWFYPKGKG